MTKRLSELSVGSVVTIKEIDPNCSSYLHLTSLGILPGDKIEILSKAPFKGPISCRHNENSQFALRPEYAQNILVISN